MLSEEQKKQILAFAKERVKGNDSYHDFSHMEKVAENAVFLAKEEGADKEACWISAILHDICKCKPGDHGTEAAAEASEFLLGLGLDKELVEKVRDAIYFHNKEFSDGSPERAVLWDADKLTIIGPYWFVYRHLPYHLAKEERKKGFRIAIDEYYFFESRFHTPLAKEIVRKHGETMHPFLRSLEEEIKEQG